MNRKIIKSFIDKKYVKFTEFRKKQKTLYRYGDEKCQNTRKIIELIESNLTGYEISKNWSFSIRTFTIKTGQTRSR